MMGGACEDWGSGAIGGKITTRLATKEVECSPHPASGRRCPGRRVYAWSWSVTPRSWLLMNAASAEMPLDPTVDVACGVINL